MVCNKMTKKRLIKIAPNFLYDIDFKFAGADSVVTFTRRLRQASAASRNGSGPNRKRKK
jgi:hypothetical protein